MQKLVLVLAAALVAITSGDSFAPSARLGNECDGDRVRQLPGVLSVSVQHEPLPCCA